MPPWGRSRKDCIPAQLPLSLSNKLCSALFQVPLLLELQQSVLPKFLQGTMDQSKGEEVVKNWRENVKNAKTMSALHTLLGILENSVKWDKSAENIVSFYEIISKGQSTFSTTVIPTPLDL